MGSGIVTSMMSTQAAVLVKTGEPLVQMRLGVPAPATGQVIVDLAFSGVCHSQINEARGLRGPDRYLPHCLGHEGSGYVRAVGADVTKVRPGDRVVLTWIRGDGHGPPGSVYAAATGPVNAGAVTTFMHATVAAENRVVPVPNDMPLREAVLLGCAVPTGGGIVLNTLRPRPGQGLAILGLGGVGISAVMVAAALGVHPIIGVDVNPSRLEMARALGATDIVDARNDDPVAAVRGLTAGQGTDFTIEAAGRVAVMEQAFAAVRHGGLCVIAGNPPFGETLAIDPFDLIRGKRILGSAGGASHADTDIARYVDLYRRGTLPLERLVGAEYGLDDINEALTDLENGRVLRPVIRLGAADRDRIATSEGDPRERG